jgi:hypothetical protein
MSTGLATSSRTKVWLPAATFSALCGLAVMAGPALRWLSADRPRPEMGIAHTALSRMLDYSFAITGSFWTSAGFAVVVLGLLMVIGALAGLRTLTVVAALLALGASGMWIGLVVHHYNTPNLPNVHYANPANLPWTALLPGAWLAITGGVLGLLSAFWLRRAA